MLAALEADPVTRSERALGQACALPCARKAMSMSACSWRILRCFKQAMSHMTMAEQEGAAQQLQLQRGTEEEQRADLIASLLG